MRLDFKHRLGLTYLVFTLFSAATFAGGGDIAKNPPPEYSATFYTVTNPANGETLYVQRIKRVAGSFVLNGESGGATERLRHYQKVAVDYIENTLNPEDRQILGAHRTEMPLPDGMIIVSRSKNFQAIDPKDIVGTIAIVDGEPDLSELEAKPYHTSDPHLEGLARGPYLHMVNARRTIAHFTSSDRDLTALTVSLGEMLLFNDPIIAKVPDSATVRVGDETMTMAEYRKRSGNPNSYAWVFPDGYQLDAFDRLGGYYRDRGFEVDDSAPAHGNLRRRVASRRDLVEKWIENIVKKAPSGQIINWGRPRAIRNMPEADAQDILRRHAAFCIDEGIEKALH